MIATLQPDGPVCIGCDRTPDQIAEYIAAAHENNMTPADYVRQEEGTFNHRNQHFACTWCYVRMGMPSSTRGWVAP